MPQDPWAEFRVGGPSRPQQPPGVIYGAPDPYKQANEQRAQQDQAMQGEGLQIQQERLRISQEEAARKQQRAESGADATEGERKAAAFLLRALGANQGYEGTGVGPRSLVGQAVSDAAPNALNSLPAWVGNSPERQVSDSAQDEFIAASLRQDSGAAIPPEELERQRRIYFPMPGDGPEAIEQKRQARLRAIEGLKQSSGRLLEPTLGRYESMRGGQEDGEVVGYDESGNPVTMFSKYEGGLFDKDGNYIGLMGRVTDDSPSQPEGGPGAGDNFLSQLGTGTVNTAAGLVQGVAQATYDLGAQAGDALEYGLRQGGGALLDAANAPQAADWWRGDFQPSLTASDAIEQISPTPEGYEGARFASQIVGGMMVPFGPKGKVPVRAPSTSEAISGNIAREVVQAGKQNNVRVMTTDVVPPKTFIGKTVQATGERIPIAGTGGQRSSQQRERVQAVKDLARDFGADVSDNYLDDIAADFAKTRGGQITTLARAKDSVIDGIPGVVQTPRAVAEIDKQIANLRGVNEGAYAPIIQELEAFKANLLSGKSLRQIEENRRILGGLFEGDNLAKIKDGGQKAINAIYGPLRDDMGDFIKQSAGNEAYNKWASANKRLSTLMGDLDSAAFRSALGKAETTPEQVARLLFNKQPSEVRRLYTNLSDEGKAKARSGLIQLAVEKAGGIDQLSPDKFANAIAQNSRAAGVVFEGADLSRLQGLERLLQYTKRASVASAAPPTGVQNAPAVGGYAAGSMLGWGAVPWLGAAGGVARLYESPLTRNLLIGLSKTKPGTEAEGKWIQRILKATATQTERIGNVANDIGANSPAAAAADENNPR